MVSLPALAKGMGIAVTVILSVFVHPFASVPVTVYVVANGVNETPSDTPLSQVYEVALPVPDKVTSVPTQTD